MGTHAVVAVRDGAGWRGVFVWYDGGLASVGTEIRTALHSLNGDLQGFVHRYIDAAPGGYRSFPGERLTGHPEMPDFVTPETLDQADPNWVYLLDPAKRTLEAFFPDSGLTRHATLAIADDGTTPEWPPFDPFDTLRVSTGWPDDDGAPERGSARRAAIRRTMNGVWRHPIAAALSRHIPLGIVFRPHYLGFGDDLSVTLPHGVVQYPGNSAGRGEPGEAVVRRPGRHETLEPVDLSWRTVREVLAAEVPIAEVELALAQGMYPFDEVRRGLGTALQRRKNGEDDFRGLFLDHSWTDAATYALLDWLRGFDVAESGESVVDPHAELRARVKAEWPEKLGELERAIAGLASADARERRDADSALYRLKRRLDRRS